MIPFVLIAALLVAIALAWLLPPFFRGTSAQARDLEQVNLGMLRDQRAELDAELARGALSAEQYAESKAELERRVLEESENQARSASGAAPRGVRVTAVLVAAALPVASAVLYLALGDPGALDLQQRTASLAGHSKQPTAGEIDGMLARLAQRLEREPDNADGWAMLARSYYILQRYPDAVRAYEQLLKLAPQEASVLADYADALAMQEGRKITGRPLELVLQALKIDPNQPKALAMAGTEAFERKDFKRAVDYWEKLRATAPPDSEIAQNITGSIAEARALGGLGGEKPPAPTAQRAPAPSAPPAASAPSAVAASVQGTVQLAPALAARAAPTDTVFVFARASEGPRVPLAVLKLQARDLPAKFVLDDSLAMAPQFRLSNFKSVIVSARLSKSGLANPSAGDFEGQGVAVSLGARDTVLTIDRVVP